MKVNANGVFYENNKCNIFVELNLEGILFSAVAGMLLLQPSIPLCSPLIDDV